MIQMRLHSDGNFDVIIKDRLYWYQTHRKQDMKRSKKWRKEHPKQYRQLMKKCDSKRRSLGFIPLNKSFDGSVAHHIDKECIVYISKELHTSISHNIWTGKGMFEINDKVFEWLETLLP